MWGEEYNLGTGYSKEGWICAYWRGDLFLHRKRRSAGVRAETPSSTLTGGQEGERRGWERNRKQREKERAARFPAGGAGQTHNIFFSARWKMRHRDPLLFFFFSASSYSSSLSSIPHLQPVLPPPSSQLEWQCAAGDPGAAGNRRTLHTRAAHLTHTYESLKLKCWQTYEHECSGSALERTRMAVLRACRGHLAHKGQCKHSCRMFTSRLSSLSWAQSLLPLSVAP